jgi:Toprim domain
MSYEQKTLGQDQNQPATENKCCALAELKRRFHNICPTCGRDKLSLTAVIEDLVRVNCLYCGSAARRAVEALGYSVESNNERPIDYERIAGVFEYWTQFAKPLLNSAADRYLISRGIDVRLLQPSILKMLRYRRARHPHNGFIYPTMIAAAASLFGGEKLRRAGIHATYLQEDGSGKADVPQAKLTFGCFRGAAVFLGPAGSWSDCEWVVGEGIETTLSAMTLLRAQGDHGPHGPPGIVALSAMGLQYVQLPRAIRRVIIAADNDSDKDGIGERVAKALRWRLWREGKIVSIAIPPKGGSDWNDVLRGNRRAELAQKYSGWLDPSNVVGSHDD